MSTTPAHPFATLTPFDEDDAELLNVVIEAPKGSRNKFDFDPERGLFYVGGVLPAGAVFPYDFGFIPATLGDDGDPVDIMVLTDDGSQAFAGCLITTRLLGGIKAEQGKPGEKSERNDRLIGVMHKSREYGKARSIDDVPVEIMEDIEHFFRSYNMAKGIEFRPLGRCGPQEARELLEAGRKKHAHQKNAKHG